MYPGIVVVLILTLISALPKDITSREVLGRAIGQLTSNWPLYIQGSILSSTIFSIKIRVVLILLLFVTFMVNPGPPMMDPVFF